MSAQGGPAVRRRGPGHCKQYTEHCGALSGSLNLQTHSHVPQVDSQKYTFQQEHKKYSENQSATFIMFYYGHGWVLLPLHHPHTVTSTPPWLIFVTVTISLERICIKLYQNSLHRGSKGTHFCSWGPISCLSYICSTFARKWQNIALSYPLFFECAACEASPLMFP